MDTFSARGLTLLLSLPVTWPPGNQPQAGRVEAGPPQLTTKTAVPTTVPLLLQRRSVLLQLLTDVNGHLWPHIPGRRRGNKQRVLGEGASGENILEMFQNTGWN